jgi:hypothetical protein
LAALCSTERLSWSPSSPESSPYRPWQHCTALSSCLGHPACHRLRDIISRRTQCRSISQYHHGRLSASDGKVTAPGEPQGADRKLGAGSCGPQEDGVTLLVLHAVGRRMMVSHFWSCMQWDTGSNTPNPQYSPVIHSHTRKAAEVQFSHTRYLSMVCKH